ncbi:MAG TPA: DUF5666 domain-containing protein [Anaerolineales bacterium]
MLNNDELLQQRLSALENGASLESVLSDLPEQDGELESLLRLAEAVRRVPHPEPLLEHTLAGQQRIFSAAQAFSSDGSQARPQNSQSFWEKLMNLRLSRPQIWVPALAGVMALFLCAVVTLAGVGIYLAGPRNAQTAALMDVSGQVEVASSALANDWKPVANTDRVHSGARIRTLAASEATLVFFDGTRTTLGPDSDLTLTRVDGDWGNVLRVILTQNAGNTSHSVVPLKGSKSSFMVFTPSGAASVHGTRFSVAVDPKGISRFAVNTGKVLVTNDTSQVFLTSGQATDSLPGQNLETPAYQFTLRGNLASSQGSTWIVSGVPFTVDAATSISGDPQVGELVQVEGRVLADGAWVADSIAPSTDNQQLSTFTGAVESMGGDTWKIGGWTVQANQETEVTKGVAEGSPVRVTFRVLDDGRWQAVKIELLGENSQPSSATPTATPDPEAHPLLTFDPDELETEACAANAASSYTFSGKLLNDGIAPADYASNVELAYQVVRGAEFVDKVELSQTRWDRIEGGEQVSFNVAVTLNAANWRAAAEDGEIKLRVFVANETNRPAELDTRLTVTIDNKCEKPASTLTIGGTPIPPITTTNTITPTVTVPAVITPTVTVTTTVPVTGTLTVTNCTGAQPHPTGTALAQSFGVPYEEIMGWFCQGFGFGEIERAYTWSRETGVPVAKIFELRRSGLGWGEIKKILPTLTVTPGPEPLVPPSETPAPAATASVLTDCTGADPQPVGMRLALQYGVPYQEIMGWFCQGFGFGEIDRAYGLSRQSGVPVASIFAMKSSGMGWGEIMKQIGGKPGKHK